MRWKLGAHIGSGAFGSVFRAIDPETGKTVAVKRIRYACEEGAGGVANHDRVGRLENEIALLQRLRHEHIVQYLGIDRDDEYVYVAMEYVPGGCIAARLREYGPLGEPLVRRHARTLVSVVAFLHQSRVAHRDIKGANILIDVSGSVKVADFGCSEELRSVSESAASGGGDARRRLAGTVPYMAPEVIRAQERYDYFKADIWSIGCTVLEMLTGEMPWGSDAVDREIQLMYRIGRTESGPPVADSLSPLARSFLAACFRSDPGRRPDANALLVHPFLQPVEASGEAYAGARASASAGTAAERERQRSSSLAEAAKRLSLSAPAAPQPRAASPSASAGPHSLPVTRAGVSTTDPNTPPSLGSEARASGGESGRRGSSNSSSSESRLSVPVSSTRSRASSSRELVVDARLFKDLWTITIGGSAVPLIRSAHTRVFTPCESSNDIAALPHEFTLRASPPAVPSLDVRVIFHEYVSKDPVTVRFAMQPGEDQARRVYLMNIPRQYARPFLIRKGSASGGRPS